MKTPNACWSILVLIVLASTILSGCENHRNVGDIPYNEDSIKRHVISIEVAREYTKAFREATDTFRTKSIELKKTIDLGRAEAFNRDAIAVLLNQKDASGAVAAGIRIYYGLGKSGESRMVLVPVDKNGNDIINTLTNDRSVSVPGIGSASAFFGGGQAVEEGQRCPVVCSNGASGL
jgi:hypothetical protein